MVKSKMFEINHHNQNVCLLNSVQSFTFTISSKSLEVWAKKGHNYDKSFLSYHVHKLDINMDTNTDEKIN